jgi:hypothetical protein
MIHLVNTTPVNPVGAREEAHVHLSKRIELTALMGALAGDPKAIALVDATADAPHIKVRAAKDMARMAQRPSNINLN